MTTDKMSTDIKSDFMSAFSGKLYGVLRWNQLDDLWGVVRKEQSEGWFIYSVGEEVPVEKQSDNSVEKFVKEINELLRRDHDEDYCGVVYTDSFESPSLIKVFDPNNLGTSCSIAEKGPLPSWIISKMKPEDISADTEQTANRRKWWQKLFKPS